MEETGGVPLVLRRITLTKSMLIPAEQFFIIADDGPCTQREFSDFMADCMNVPRPKSVPGFIIRIVMGKLIYETVTMNCRVSTAKAKEYLGWKLKFPTYHEGLPNTIGEIENRAVQMRAGS